LQSGAGAVQPPSPLAAHRDRINAQQENVLQGVFFSQFPAVIGPMQWGLITGLARKLAKIGRADLHV
jgi:hypothetical protein